jgi:hypothetical protein
MRLVVFTILNLLVLNQAVSQVVKNDITKVITKEIKTERYDHQLMVQLNGDSILFKNENKEVIDVFKVEYDSLAFESFDFLASFDPFNNEIVVVIIKPLFYYGQFSIYIDLYELSSFETGNKIEFEMPFVTIDSELIQYDGFEYSLLCLENGPYFSLHFNEMESNFLLRRHHSSNEK